MATLLLRPSVQSCKQITVYSSLFKFASNSKATYSDNTKKNYGISLSKKCVQFVSYGDIRFQSENYFDRGGSPKSEDLGSKVIVFLIIYLGDMHQDCTVPSTTGKNFQPKKVSLGQIGSIIFSCQHIKL